MQLITFPNYQRYYKAQLHADWRKSAQVGFRPNEIEAVVEWCHGHGNAPVPWRVLCHGARTGQEIDEFRKLVSPAATVIGTDLFPRDHGQVLEWDFHKQREEWIGQFDIVYSNSLDHTYDPHQLLPVWFAQLSSLGILAIQWNTNNVWTRGGDCFGAGLHEYMDLMNQYGRVRDLIFLEPGHCTTVVIADKHGGWQHRKSENGK